MTNRRRLFIITPFPVASRNGSEDAGCVYLCLSLRGVTAVTRVMNVDEVARYLRVVPDTIYRKARKGEIPAIKMGKVWRFPKETLDKWLNDVALETVKKA